MIAGLRATFRLLSTTNNEAAVRVLLPALNSPHKSIQEQALVALLTRRSVAGGHEIIRRLHDIPQSWREIIRRHHGRMTRALRDAILGTDPQMCVNGCRAAVWFREYDLIPTLLNLLEDPAAQNADLGAETLLELAGQLYEELAGPRDYQDRRDPQLVRGHIVGSLERAVKRFVSHKRPEVIEAFLLLVNRDNVTLKQVLQDPHDAAFLAMVEILSNNPHGGVIRLLLSLFDDPHAPSAALSVVTNRSDLRFVHYLLRKIGREPAATVAQNLKRISAVAWLRLGEAFLEQLDDADQHAVVQMLSASAIPRRQAFATIQYLLLYGKVGGRRAAAAALAEFNGAAANAAALRALDDPDPQVQANLIGHLRRRGIPGVLPRLVEMVDSPHAVVRHAVREALGEFSFTHFVSTFDSLDDEVRRSTGLLVRKVDPHTPRLLKEEMQSRLRTRRLRGIAIARAIDLVEDLEEAVTDLLSDEDHLVRVEAATALALGNRPESRRALEEVLNDRSLAVQEAAQRSLDQRARAEQEAMVLIKQGDTA